MRRRLTSNEGKCFYIYTCKYFFAFDLALFYLFIRRVRKTLYHDPNSQYKEKKNCRKKAEKVRPIFRSGSQTR